MFAVKLWRVQRLGWKLLPFQVRKRPLLVDSHYILSPPRGMMSHFAALVNVCKIHGVDLSLASETCS